MHATLLLCLTVSTLSMTTTSNNVARIAVAQLRSTRHKHRNLIDVAKCAGWAKRSGAIMLFLPECLGFMGDNATHTLAQADPIISNQELDPSSFHQSLSISISYPDDHNDIAYVEDDYSSILQGLRFIARESNLWISGGGVHTRVPKSQSISEQQKIYNTHVIIDNNGQIKSHYHKIHLFDVSIPNRVNLQESKTTEPGNKLVLTDSPIGKLGLSICYDMRFSELYYALVKEGAQILLAPSAFTVPTGKAHWHTLLRARAIEGQCYVIAAAQVGKHNEKRESYGHSLVYDPWGELLADAGGYDGVGTSGVISTDEISPVVTPSIVTCDIDLGKLATVRESMPMSDHRRNSKYSL